MMTEHRFTHAKWKANGNIESMLELRALDFCLFSVLSKIAGGAALPPEAARETKNSFDRLSRTLARGQSCSQICGVITQHLLAKPDALAGVSRDRLQGQLQPLFPLLQCCLVSCHCPAQFAQGSGGGSALGMGAWLNNTFG